MQITGRRGTSRPSRVVRPGHAVADPALGHDVGRPRRVVAQLAAELLDAGAHQLHVAGLPSAPHLAQQRVVVRIPTKSITNSDRNRSPVPTETDHLSERSGAGPGITSPGSRFLSPVGVIAWTLPSCRAWLDASTGTDLRMLDAGRRGRPGALPDFEEEDDGLWALWETALFAVFQAPVGAVFASMGAAASTAPRGAPAVLLGPGRARTQRRGGGGCTPIGANLFTPPAPAAARSNRSTWRAATAGAVAAPQARRRSFASR